RFGGPTNIVVTRAIAPDGTLGTPQDLSPADQSSVVPRVAVAPSGTAAVVWQVNSLGQEPVPFVHGRTDAATGGLSPVRPLSQAAAGGGMFPMIGIDGRGTATAVWQRGLGDTGVVEAARFSADGPDGPTTTLSAPSEEMQFPTVAVTATGTALAVWGQETPAHDGVRIEGARFPSPGWGAALPRPVLPRWAVRPTGRIVPGR